MAWRSKGGVGLIKTTTMGNNILRKFLLSGVALLLPIAGVFANTTQTVTQVTTAVTVPSATDYHISGSTPFGSDGTVSLARGGTAVVILDAVVPSKAVGLLGSHVLIDGQKAVRGSNCDIRIHAQGTIIYPYTEKDAPLTVYSEQNYGGTAVSDFGLESSNGFMNTLTDAKLNNKIRSFKLRRGFMVTFSTRAGGYGYSRCFIAADEDMDMATLPAILDRSITSYRVFKWNDNSKKGLANNTDVNSNTLLRTTSAYSFGPGGDMGLDFECVRHHIHEAWPSIASMGDNSYQTSNPTIKTNNEPANSADDNPATVDQVLANWQALMATGKRLCSPSYYDGGYNWQRAFMDSIDARGWRCDVMDLHCYWPEGSFGNLAGWYRDYHRPIWISEWVWGASWNSNGAFASGVTEADNATHVMNIVRNLESWDYVERYFYWDSERDPSHLIKDGKLTAAGKQYAALNSVVGYKASLQYVPTTPKAKGAPSNLAVKYDKDTRDAVVTWHEPNGEYNASMTIERQLPGSSDWETVVEIVPEEDAADYSYTVKDVERGTKFRIHTVYATGTDYYTNRAIEAVPDELGAGDEIAVDGKTLYVGGDVLDNGDFAMGLYGWTNGEGKALEAPAFEAFAKGGYNDKPFVQAFSHGGQKSANSIYTTVSVEPNTYYYVSGAVNFPGGASFSSVILSGDNAEDTVAFTLPAADNWRKFGQAFYTGNHSRATFSFRWLAAQAEYSGISLQKLVPSKDDAIADANAAQARRVELEKSHPTFAMKAEAARADSVAAATEALADAGLAGSGYTFNDESSVISEPLFATSTAKWVKAGSYTGGTQKTGSLDGVSCWTARWTGVAASEGKSQTMEVRQELGDELSHGVYMLSVDAATDHYGVSDQHGYLAVNGDSLVTPTLSWDVADLPTIAAAEKWQTLSTVPVYVDNDTKAVVGFTGSKSGATDNLYKPYGEQNGKGDQREGSWYATNFRLLHLPVYRMHTDASLWRGLCLPYAVKATDNLRLYTIAGRDEAGTKIYLQEVSEVEAGQPCVAHATDSVLMVVEDGEPVKTAKSKQNGLRGYLTTSKTSRAQKGWLVLKDGYWQTQTSSVRNEREALYDYIALLTGIDDVTVLDSWSGLSLPVDKTPTAIDGVSVDDNANGDKAAQAVYFDLNGRRVPAPSRPGVYVRIYGDKVEKVVVK